ncbi:MAG: transglutaminase domain-containing protein [Dehalococcoidia bacterium]|nr:MAG: transglutaminase domain-containing protein [Dehalococcoidia bacterium]
MAVRPLDDYFAPGREDEGPGPAWWLSWEEWLTFTLLVFLMVPVVGSLQSADWVDEMPSLVATSMWGLILGWLIAKSPLPGWMGAALGLVSASVTTLLLVMRSLLLIGTGKEDGWVQRWSEFWLRLADWWRALLAKDFSADPLPFVVLLVFSVFIVAYVTVWSTARWKNPWTAVLPGGFVLLTNISYLPGQPSFAVVVFVVASVLLVTRLQYTRAAERWGHQHVRPPDFMSVEVLVVASIVAGVLVLAAWTVPTANNWSPVAQAWGRVISPIADRLEGSGGVFVGISAKKSVPVHTLGPTLPLQGPITLDGTPIFQVSSPEALTLRGAVYDQYTGAGWKLSHASARQLDLTIEQAEQGTEASRAQVRRPVKVTVAVVGEGGPVRRLLAPGDPLATDQTGRILGAPGAQAAAIAPDRDAKAGGEYTTVGAVSAAAVNTLHDAGTAYPDEIFRTYTQLPPGTPPEIAELTRQVIGTVATPYEAVRRVETYLRETYTYTLQPDRPAPRRDAVAFFLFDEKAGYFDHFASAMAVMLRSIGIPTRLAAGFALDSADFDSTDKVYTVSEERAWTWPEVYFPNLGWVEFNPTPSRGVVARPGDDTAAVAAAAEHPGDSDLDALLFEGLDDTDPALQGGSSGVITSTGAGRRLIARILASMLVISAAGLAVVFVVRWWWGRPFRGLSQPLARWSKVMRLAELAGIAPDSAHTPAEAAESLVPAVGERPALRALALSYTNQRYARQAVPEAEDEAAEADRHYRAVSAVLWKRIGRRVLRFWQAPERSRPVPLAGAARAQRAGIRSMPGAGGSRPRPAGRGARS